MFKVGDKVRCFAHVGVLSAGAVYTVREPYEDDHLTGKRGEFVYVGGDLRRWGGYYPDRFELVKPEPQAAAIAGGLQEHSVGEYYPLAAVLYEHGNERIITIENLQEGSVATSVKDSGYPLAFDSHDEALTAIEEGGLIFSEGRPHCVASANVWVLYKETNPVRVVRLRSMLHRQESQ